MYFHSHSILPYSLIRALKEQSTVPGQAKAFISDPSLSCSNKLYLKDTSLTFSVTPVPRLDLTPTFLITMSFPSNLLETKYNRLFYHV